MHVYCHSSLLTCKFQPSFVGVHLVTCLCAAFVWTWNSSASFANISVLCHQNITLFFFTEMLWYGNNQNMVWFQMRYTNFLVLGMKILLSGNTFCVKWWICSCDLCKWLSGGFVAHPILAVKYSFLVTSDILDEFPWLANVLHNCQNFAMVFLRNIEKGEFSSTSRFFWTGFFFFFFFPSVLSSTFILSSNLLQTSQFALLNTLSDTYFVCLMMNNRAILYSGAVIPDCKNAPVVFNGTILVVKCCDTENATQDFSIYCFITRIF